MAKVDKDEVTKTKIENLEKMVKLLENEVEFLRTSNNALREKMKWQDIVIHQARNNKTAIGVILGLLEPAPVDGPKNQENEARNKDY